MKHLGTGGWEVHTKCLCPSYTDTDRALALFFGDIKVVAKKHGISSLQWTFVCVSTFQHYCLSSETCWWQIHRFSETLQRPFYCVFTATCAPLLHCPHWLLYCSHLYWEPAFLSFLIIANTAQRRRNVYICPLLSPLSPSIVLAKTLCKCFDPEL